MGHWSPSVASTVQAPLVEFNDFSPPTVGGEGAEDELLVVFLLFSDLVDDDADGTTRQIFADVVYQDTFRPVRVNYENEFSWTDQVVDLVDVKIGFSSVVFPPKVVLVVLHPWNYIKNKI